MSELLIVGAITAGVLFLWVWPKITIEEVVHLPDDWDPATSRGRVRQRAGGWDWKEGGSDE